MCEHLTKRGSRYYFRRKVPLDLIDHLGKKELVHSLGTSDPAEAKRLCRLESVRTDSQFEQDRAAVRAATCRPDWSPFTSREQEDLHDERAAMRDEGFEQDIAEQFELDVQRGLAVQAEINKRATDQKLRPVEPLNTSGLTLADIHGKWETTRKPAARSAAACLLTIKKFRQHVGAVPVTRIRPDHIRRFREAMQTSGQTAVNTGKHLAQLKTLLGFAMSEGMIESNPATGIKIESRSAPGDRKLPFEQSHLKLIFRDAQINPVYHWLPRLQLYTGARVNELAQLRPGDIRTDDNGVIYLDIVDDAEGARLKNAGSRRRVPVHPDLLALGFVAFAESRNGSDWLFDLTGDKYGNRSANYVKWLGKHLRAVGIADKRLTGHSFRHLFATLARESGVAENETSALMGHVGGSVHRRYGQWSITALSAAMASITFPAI